MSFSLQVVKHPSGAALILSIVILALLALDFCMVVASYGQFGWRVYSKIACDLRTKDGKSKQQTFLLIHAFLSMLKLDALVSPQPPLFLACLPWHPSITCQDM